MSFKVYKYPCYFHYSHQIIASFIFVHHVIAKSFSHSWLYPLFSLVYLYVYSVVYTASMVTVNLDFSYSAGFFRPEKSIRNRIKHVDMLHTESCNITLTYPFPHTYTLIRGQCQPTNKSISGDNSWDDKFATLHYNFIYRKTIFGRCSYTHFYCSFCVHSSKMYQLGG